MIEVFQTKLNELASALAGDGYALRLVAVSDGRVSVQMVALDAACENCLIPQSALEGILFEALNQVDPQVQAVCVTMP